MRYKALHFMEKHVHHKTSKGWTIVAWHWPSSITWRWLLHYLPGYHKLRLFKHTHNQGIYFDLLTPLGRFNFQTQRNMFKSTLSKADNQTSEYHGKDY